MASKVKSTDENHQSIKTLEEEIKGLKKHLQSLSKGPKAAEKSTSTNAKASAPKSTPSKKATTKKASANKEANKKKVAPKEFKRQLKEEYAQSQGKHLQELAREVERLLNSHQQSRANEWKELELELQNASESRKEYIIQLKAQAIQDRIDRLNWVKQLHEARIREMDHFFTEFHQDCKNSQELRKQEKAERKARLQELFKR